MELVPRRKARVSVGEVALEFGWAGIADSQNMRR